MKIIKKAIVVSLKQLDLGSAVAVRLTKYTGKSNTFVHPKHLLSQNPWFIKFIKKSDVVLDLGCGYGQNSLKIARCAKKVVGVDFDNNLLKLAQILTNQKKIRNIKFQNLDLEQKLPFKNKSFDKVILLDVLEHIRKREQLLDGIKRVLKPYGFAIIGVPNSHTSWKKFQRSAGVCSYSDPDHKIEFSASSIKKLLTRHNFKIIHFGYGKYDTPLRGLFDIIGAVSLSLYKMTINWRTSMVSKFPNEASGFEIVASK